jgi:serine/threonine-protein kinase
MQPTAVGTGKRYLAEELLGEDALGTVWRGVDGRSGAAVTVRLLDERLTSDPTRLHRATAQLRRLQWRASNPHLAPVLDHDLRAQAPRPLFVVFDADGETLAHRLELGETLTPEAVLHVVAAVADGLAFAHAAWIFHGALTTSSVLVDAAGGVKVIDTGLGELLGEAGDGRGAVKDASLIDQGAIDVLALATVFERLLAPDPAAEVSESDAPRTWGAEVPAAIGLLLRRALSGHHRMRPDMAQLAAGLAAARSRAPAVGSPVSWQPRPMEPAPADEPVAPEARTASGPVAAPVRPGSDAEPRPRKVEPPPAGARVAPMPAPPMPAPPVMAPPRPPRRGRIVVALVSLVVLATVVVGLAVLRSADETPDAPTVPTPTPTVDAPTASPTVVVQRATVPDVLGEELESATLLIEQAGLLVGVVTTVPGSADVVVRTDPTPGEAVAAGTAVDLFVGNGVGG